MLRIVILPGCFSHAMVDCIPGSTESIDNVRELYAKESL